MKIMRFLPLLALAVLGIIAYSLYKRGTFINKEVRSEKQTTSNELGETPTPMSPTAADTLASIVTLTPSPVVSTHENAEKKVPKTLIKRDTAVKTTLAAAPKSGEKKGEKPVSKTTTTAVKGAATMKPDAETFKAAKALEKKAAIEPRYHVVIGSFSSEVNAKAKAAQFEKANNKKSNVTKQGGFYRVCADEFEFEQSAAAYSRKLKNAGVDNLVLKF